MRRCHKRARRRLDPLLLGLASRELGHRLEAVFSYLTLIVGSTLICYIDDPSRTKGRKG